jgi:hypothetical protein
MWEGFGRRRADVAEEGRKEGEGWVEESIIYKFVMLYIVMKNNKVVLNCGCSRN